MLAANSFAISKSSISKGKVSHIFFTWLIPLYFLLVIGLQFHFTPSILGVPVRFGFADLISGFLCIFCLIYVVTQERQFIKKLYKSWVVRWFIIFTVWLGFSLFWGYYNTQQLHSWALVNKFMGWFILMGYCFLGNFLVRHFYSSSIFLKILKCLFITSWCIAFCCFIGLSIKNNFNTNILTLDTSGRAAGFLENPNAFGFMAVCIALLELPFSEKGILFNKKLHYLGLALNFVAIFYSGSRTAYLALIIGIAFIWRNIHQSVIKIVLLTIPLLLFLQVNFMQQSLQSDSLNTYFIGKYYDNNQLTVVPLNRGDKVRFFQIKEALTLWMEHPLLGIGLAGYIQHQIHRHSIQDSALEPKTGASNGGAYKFLGKPNSNYLLYGGDHSPTLLHNTALWLLTETGLIGFLLCLGFGTSIIIQIYKAQIFKAHPNNQPMLIGLTAIFIASIISSQTMEVFYQRHIWFLFGVGLVLFKANKDNILGLSSSVKE